MPEKLERGTRGHTRRILSRQFRYQPTPAEASFWELVRDYRFDGYQFRRQHPLGSYIADFYCHKLGLVIEIDGEVHKTQLERDRERDENLRTYGIHVIRITNAELLANPQHVLQQLREIIKSLPGT